MELALTSFGLSHLPRRDINNPDIFYRMPPVSLSEASQFFTPDYAVLLLAHRVILDERCFSRLTQEPHPAYQQMAETVQVLEKEGFARIASFDDIVAQKTGLLDRMLTKDLKELDQWIPALREACESWYEFVDSVSRPLQREIVEGRLKGIGEEDRDKIEAEHILSHHTVMYMHHAASQTSRAMMMVHMAMDSARTRRKAEFKKYLRDTLAEYLSYVNANIVLCNELGCGLHDWYDFQPFYREKFLRVGREQPPGASEQKEIKRLFEVPFPEFTFWNASDVMKALQDRRIEDLRKLVDQAVKGEVIFDREFAVRALQEVLGVEQSIGRIRNIVSYLTMPIGLVPWVGTPLQKGVEEAIVGPIASRKREPHSWFFLISEMSQKHRKRQVESPDNAEQSNAGNA